MTAAPTTLVCQEIRLRQFRNFAELDLHFPPAGAAIIGDNGAGKTNLLEAVQYLEMFRSFRGGAEDQFVRFGADAFHVRGRFADLATGRVMEISAGYESRTRRKRVLIDGVETERIGDAIGHAGSVIFSPSDVEIVSGGPAERRRFLDIVLSLNSRGYLQTLQRFRHVLRQRNAALRDGVTGDALLAWNTGLIDSGAPVIRARARWVAEHASRFAQLYSAIGGAEALLDYDGDIATDIDATVEEIRGAFEERLQRVSHRERERGLTLAGPHRDDMSLLLSTADGAVDLRQYGSGGQRRTGAIVLRMVEAETVRTARGIRPMLLLDDVFAELDPGRSRRIIELLGSDGHGQVLLTAPKATDVLLDDLVADRVVAPLARWRIAAAKVTT
jgi:DNA replication and repair protein RecF